MWTLDVVLDFTAEISLSILDIKLNMIITLKKRYIDLYEIYHIARIP